MIIDGPEFEKVLATDYSESFDELRKKQMVVGHYKYGSIRKNAKNRLIEYIPTLEKRVQAYKETGNTEFLADIANFAMIEYMYPQHPNAHYTPTDSDGSPGVVGMSEQEIQEFEDED